MPRQHMAQSVWLAAARYQSLIVQACIDTQAEPFVSQVWSSAPGQLLSTGTGAYQVAVITTPSNSWYLLSTTRRVDRSVLDVSTAAKQSDLLQALLTHALTHRTISRNSLLWTSR